jgi:dynactin-6
VLADHTVALPNGLRRRDSRGPAAAELGARAQAREIEVLRKLIPNKADRFAGAA